MSQKRLLDLTCLNGGIGIVLLVILSRKNSCGDSGHHERIPRDYRRRQVSVEQQETGEVAVA